MFEAKKGNWDTPGTWTPIEKPDGSKTAVFVCPKCGVGGFLVSHQIATDGTVTPSVICAATKGCTFHDYIKLLDWTAPA